MNQKESEFLTKWRESSSITMFFSSIFVVFAITLISMTVSFMAMLFSSGDDGIRYCFFKTIYFEAITNAYGDTSLAFGFTGSTFPILFFAGILFIFIFGTYFFAKKLLKYRQHLIETR